MNRAEFHEFRKGRGGDYYVSLTIPADADRDAVPIAAVRNDDGSYTYDIKLLYVSGDVCLAKQNAVAILADHPAWFAHIRSLSDLTVNQRIFKESV